MPCSFARFVVHYKNGKTVVEDRSKSDCWDSMPNKNNIIALGILYDPLVLNERDKDGKQLRISNLPQQLILKGSKRHNYQFFQFKTVDMQIGASKDRKAGRHEVNLTVGMVVDKMGHCMVLEAMPNVIIRTYYTTTYSLRLNLDLFKINLNEIN